MKNSKKLTLNKMIISKISNLAASHVRGGVDPIPGQQDHDNEGDNGKSFILLELCKNKR